LIALKNDPRIYTKRHEAAASFVLFRVNSWIAFLSLSAISLTKPVFFNIPSAESQENPIR